METLELKLDLYKYEGKWYADGVSDKGRRKFRVDPYTDSYYGTSDPNEIAQPGYDFNYDQF